MAISVNIFGLRRTIEAHPRSNNGQPPQTTTGVARTSSVQVRRLPERKPPCPAAISDMARKKIGAVSAALTQNRRDILSSSGSACSSAVTWRGSSAIPQIGHAPGPFRTTSGCIGQVYSLAAPDGFAAGGECFAAAGGAPAIPAGPPRLTPAVPATPRYRAGSLRNLSAQPRLQK